VKAETPSLLGRADLDTLLAHREDLNSDLQTIIEKQTEPWGVEVGVVEIKDVEIPESMQRATAREAEAERKRRAKVINARGELQASEELRQAADTLSRSPASLQLRYLQTLLELGADQNSTVVFPLPVDIGRRVWTERLFRLSRLEHAPVDELDGVFHTYRALINDKMVPVPRLIFAAQHLFPTGKHQSWDIRHPALDAELVFIAVGAHEFNLGYPAAVSHRSIPPGIASDLQRVDALDDSAHAYT
jgi:hypothetical protein